MLTTENNCVGCPQGCINCGRKHQEVIKCDGFCCDEYAKYHTSILDEGDYCEDCLEKLLLQCFQELSLSEQIEVMKDHLFVKEL